MSARHDLVIVGGGPAGLATALHAARAGLDTVVVEPRPAPVDKACGEGLMPGAVRSLAALGLAVPGVPVSGIRYVQGARGVQAAFRHGPGMGVRRTDLHGVLHRAVLAAGVPVLPLRVAEVRQDRAGVSVPGTGLRSRWLVGADGLHSRVRRSLGLEVRTRGAPRYGLRRHYAVAPWSPYVEVHWGSDAEAYVTPIGPRLVGIAVLTTRRASFTSHLEGFPALAARLPPDRAVTSVRGAGPCGSGPAPGPTAGSCSSATPPDTSTPSPVRASPSPSSAPKPWSPTCAGAHPAATRPTGAARPAGTGC